MSLTGSIFGWGTILITAALFVVAVAVWPRLAAGRFPHVLGRIALMIGVNLLVLVTAAVQLNDQYLFFADWSDLHGAFSGTTTATDLHRGAKSAQAAWRPVAGTAATAPQTLEPLPPGTPLQSGAVSYLVYGPLSGITAQVIVRVPSQYQSDPTARFPVLQTFSGYPGAAAQWVTSMGLPAAIDQQVDAGRLHPVVIVSAQWELPAGVDTECVNGPIGRPQVETWLTQDVPDWVAAHFRVATDRGSWATLGMSAGGWCAAMAATLHPAQYGGGIVMAGYFRPIFGPGYEPFTPKDALERRYDLVAVLRKRPPPLALWLGTSHADALSYSTTSQLLTKAGPPLVISATVLQNAGHRTQVWLNLLPAALTWLGTGLPGFAH